VATPDGKRVHVANSVSNNVSVIDTAGGTVQSSIALSGFPDDAAVSPSAPPAR